MRYNLSNIQDLNKFKHRVKAVIEKGAKVDFSEPRTNKTNSALHLYFTFISDALNELGQEFIYEGVVKSGMSTQYSPYIVKEFFFRPLQMHLFNIESTKDLQNDQLNQIIEIVNRFFAEKGVDICFPSIESLIEKSL